MLYFINKNEAVLSGIYLGRKIEDGQHILEVGYKNKDGNKSSSGVLIDKETYDCLEEAPFGAFVTVIVFNKDGQIACEQLEVSVVIDDITDEDIEDVYEKLVKEVASLDDEDYSKFTQRVYNEIMSNDDEKEREMQISMLAELSANRIRVRMGKGIKH